ncbi:hypothetical protein [Thiococcus pfennigii]|uniref:hypothetical protein n=1 Tax=Thiococcus pfennigii TaxID=1057 RepID=UPI0030B8E2DD
MARALRIELADGLYHFTSRGDRREAIYRDDADRSAWLELLGDVCSTSGVKHKGVKRGHILEVRSCNPAPPDYTWAMA